jgi:4-amino-4-deoxy-L-arabinose transferase-like glycosyltransferase
MTGVSARRNVTLACFIAALHGLFFIWYQRPDWTNAWSDQEGYARLGRALADTGQFTPAPGQTPFVPEVIRTPAYPAFIAIVYRLFGVHHIWIAAAQVVLFVATCLLVFDIARRVASESIAANAALATALFPPIPYFAALVMTEVWTTFLLTAAMALVIRSLGRCRPGTFAALGVVLALTALSRPAFVLFPIALAAVGVVLFPMLGVRRRPAPGGWIVMLGVFAVFMVPWFAYNYAAVGRVTVSPAGGAGRGIWEGSWQAQWPGRLQSELTGLAESVDDRLDLDRRVEAVAAREQRPAPPMLEYVHQWQDLHRIWANPAGPYEGAMSRVAADQAYLRVGLANTWRDTFAHQVKRLARGVFILWAGEIPFRYSDINRLPPLAIRACWLAQILLCASALVGVYALARVNVAGACLLATPIVYVTAVHLPFLTEARQSLPAQPVLLILATVGAAHVATAFKSHPLLALEPEVHERQHF